MRRWWAVLALCVGCGDGLSFGLSGCDENGAPFPRTELNTVASGLTTALTAAGVDFLVERRELLAGLLFDVDRDGWVRLSLPPLDFGDQGGGLGVGVRDLRVGFDLRSAEIELDVRPDPARIHLAVKHARVRLDDGVVWISVGGSAACRLGNGLDAQGPEAALVDADIEVELVPLVDETGRLQVHVEVLPFSVHALDFELLYDRDLPECADGNTAAECRLVCGVGDAGADLFEAVYEALGEGLNDLFLPVVDNLVQFLVDDFTDAPLFVEGVLHPRVLEALLPTAADAHPIGFYAGPSPNGFTLRAGGGEGDGFGLELDVGTDTVDHPCVPPAGAPPRFTPGVAPALTGYDHAGSPYHLGVAVSDSVVNRAAWTAYRAGVLCVALDSAQIEALLGQRVDTDTLSLVLPGLRELTGTPQPVLITLDTRFEPADLPLATLFEVADDGGIPQAGVALNLPRLGISFYGYLEERWSRLFAATVSVQLGVVAQATPDNRLVLDVGTPRVGDLAVDYNELLEGANIDLLLDLVVDLLSSALLSEGLAFDLGLDGLLAQLTGLPLELKIAELRVEGARGDFLGVLLSLADGAGGSGARAAVDTRALLVRATPGRAELAVDAGGPARFQWRVGRGPWRPLVAAPGGRLTVDDPRLLPDGPHRLEVRAVAEGDYRTLDPTPAVVEVAPAPALRAAPRGCSTGGLALFPWLALLAVRRRR